MIGNSTRVIKNIASEVIGINFLVQIKITTIWILSVLGIQIINSIEEVNVIVKILSSILITIVSIISLFKSNKNGRK